MADAEDTNPTDEDQTSNVEDIQEKATLMLANEALALSEANQEKVREALVERLNRASPEELLKIEETFKKMEKEKEGQEYEM